MKNFRPGRLRNCRVIFSSHLDVERLGWGRGAEAAPQVLTDPHHACVLRLPITGLDPHNICIFGGSQLLGGRQVLGLHVKLDVAAAVMLIAYLAARTRNQSTCDERYFSGRCCYALSNPKIVTAKQVRRIIFPPESLLWSRCLHRLRWMGRLLRVCWSNAARRPCGGCSPAAAVPSRYTQLKRIGKRRFPSAWAFLCLENKGPFSGMQGRL